MCSHLQLTSDMVIQIDSCIAKEAAKRIKPEPAESKHYYTNKLMAMS